MMYRSIVIVERANALYGQVMDAVHITQLFQVGIIRMVFFDEQQGGGMPVVHMNDIKIAKGSDFDGLGDRCIEYHEFNKVVKKRLGRVIMIDVGYAPLGDFGMMYYIMRDVVELLFWLDLIQFGSIGCSFQRKVQIGHKSTILM